MTTAKLANQQPRRGGWPGPRKKQIVVPLDPEVVNWVERYADRNNITRAEAIRRLVDVGRRHTRP